jgi:hypothetical protein
MAWRKLGDLDACCITLSDLAPIVEQFEVLKCVTSHLVRGLWRIQDVVLSSGVGAMSSSTVRGVVR